MAAVIEVTAAAYVVAALDALTDADRASRDERAHLLAALAQDPVEPGTLAQAARVVDIVIASAQRTKALIRDAQQQVADAQQQIVV